MNSPRRRFQIQLSTTVVTMLFCAVMLGLNARPQYASRTNTYGFPFRMAVEIRENILWKSGGNRVFIGQTPWLMWYGNAALNAGFALVNVIAIAAFFEWLARKTIQASSSPWYRLHRPTVIVLILVAGLWIAANLVSRGPNHTGWHYTHTYGFPFIYFMESGRNTADRTVNQLDFGMHCNVYIAMMTLLLVTFASELFVRRRLKRPS